MKLRRVTLTGADNSVEAKDLRALTAEFPFVEWGILLSKSAEGKTRYPTRDWINSIACGQLALSGHMCGRWSRDICKGNWTFLEDRPALIGIFNRLQINGKLTEQYVNYLDMPRGFKDRRLGHIEEFIFQEGNAQTDTLRHDFNKMNINVVGLFDLSGGKGLLPSEWPKRQWYCGYAGGLGPENLEEQLELIAEAAGDNEIWVDMESGLRNPETDEFDLDRCVACLEIAKGWI